MSTRPATELVEADLPITPMLDMSFQLLSFFIMTFHPSPTEGQIALALPPSDNPGGNERFDVQIEKPTRYISQIIADDQGKISGITLREEGAPDDGARQLGADVAVLMKELKAITTAEQKRRDKETARGNVAPPPPKLTFEMSDKLVQAYVVQVFDAAVQAGFADITTVPIDRARR
ncbi:MAG: biopolymer transporter ExbD [Planctomycetes bacterium]|nr:biopolymer transporter ExbD [Planctomycetota bacterium]